jgi:transposase
VQVAPATSSTIVVAVDVGKSSAMFSVTDGARQRLLGPVEFAMTYAGLSSTVHQVMAMVGHRGFLGIGSGSVDLYLPQRRRQLGGAT